MRQTRPDKQTVITASNLTLGFNHKPIVSDIDLNIYSGEFIGIFGPNGAGKSTFLRTLLGLIKPLQGEITVLGAKPKKGHAKIGYMPQLRSHLGIANLTSRTLIEATYQGNKMGLPLLSKHQKQEIQQIIETVSIQDYADLPFQQLSGGERQRVYLAQALLGNPVILLLDEPLASLDPRYQETFINLLRDIQKKFPVTILFTAHDVNPLLGTMHRVLYFAQGKAVIGSVNDVITSKTLSDLYGTTIEVIHYKERLIVLGDGQNYDGGHRA